MSKKRVAALAAAAGLALAMISPTPAQAAANLGVAVPGSFTAGYATPVIVVTKDAPFNFVSADIQGHDIVSVAPGSVRGHYLFASDVIPLAGVSEVQGMQNTVSGETYEFFCSIHPGTMRGELTVL